MLDMKKRYQVFVSSTYKDLTDERAAVIQMILNLNHFPAGMEMFPAANEDQWRLIQRVIDESDYYIVVVGGRYGFRQVAWPHCRREFWPHRGSGGAFGAVGHLAGA
jgi:hypothetical protein